METIDWKFPGPAPNDLHWASLEPSRANVIVSDEPQSPIPNFASPATCLTDASASDPSSLRDYWRSVKAKYSSNGCIFGGHCDVQNLPPEWAVVSITVTEDRNTIFITRHQNGQQPLVFCIPLDRQGRREGEEEQFTFSAATAELNDIIKSSDRIAHSARGIESRDDKIIWWRDRTALDKRMKELLANIEFCWLGAFKVRTENECTIG